MTYKVDFITQGIEKDRQIDKPGRTRLSKTENQSNIRKNEPKQLIGGNCLVSWGEGVIGSQCIGGWKPKGGTGAQNGCKKRGGEEES